MTKMIQLKPYAISNARQLGLQVERPEWSTTVSFFPLFQTTKTLFLVCMQYFRLHIQSWRLCL